MIGSLVVLLLLLVIPGAILGFVSGLRTGWALAAGPALTLATGAIAASVLGLIGIDFTIVSVAVVWLVLLLAAVGWRLVAGGVVKHKPVKATLHDALIALPALIGVIIGAGANFLPVWNLRKGDDTLDMIPQTWDPNWHGSVIRYIQESGVASPTHMGELQNYETGWPIFYPTGWHTFAATLGEITGDSVIGTMNLTGMAITAVTLPLAAAVLAWMMIRRAGLTRSLAAGFAAIASAALPTLYLTGFGVGAWPYVVALSLAPVTFALFVNIPYQPVRIFAAVLALYGVAQVHLAALSIVVVFVAAYWLLLQLWRPARPELGRVKSRLRDLALMLIPGLLAVSALIPSLQVLVRYGQGEAIQDFEVNAVADDRGQSWLDAFQMMTRHASEDPVVYPVLIAGLVGLAFALLWRWALWPLAALALFLVTTVHGILPIEGFGGDLLSYYADMHYATPHRLIMPVALMYSAGAGIAVAVVIRLVCMGPVRKWEPWNSVVAVVVSVAVASYAAPWATQQQHHTREFAFESLYTPRVVDFADMEAMDWLAEQPEAWRHNTWGIPEQGTAWLYARTGLPSIFHHFQWPDVDLESDTNLINWHADKIGAGNGPDAAWERNTVDEAVENLDVAFFVISPPNIWGNQEYYWPIHDGVWNAPGTTPVYRDDNVGIVAVNRLVSVDAIERMREESPIPMGTLPTRSEVGLASSSDSDADDPYVFIPGTSPLTYPLVQRPSDQADPPYVPKPFADPEALAPPES